MTTVLVATGTTVLVAVTDGVANVTNSFTVIVSEANADPVLATVSDLTLDDFSRVELDVPLSFGVSGKVGHLWFGPKLVFSRYDAHLTACLSPGDSGCAREATLGVGGTAFYVAGQLGAAIGWKRVWFAAELTVAYVSAGADVELSMGGHSSSHHVSSDGVVLQPAVGLLVWL